MSDKQMTSTGEEEASVSAKDPTKRPASNAENNGGSMEQNTTEEGVNHSDSLDHPVPKRQKLETSAATPLFFEKPLSVAFQVSSHCHVGPIFDENRIRNLPPYEARPFPDQYTKIVQDVIRCAHRPEEVFKTIQAAADGEPSTIVTYFDRVEGTLKARNIPVVKTINNAQAWLSRFLQSLGCCMKLFVPDFISKDFVCKQCLTSELEHLRAKIAPRKEMSAQNLQEDEGQKNEAERRRKMEEKRIVEDRRMAEEEKQKMDEKERADMKEETKEAERERKVKEWEEEETMKEENVAKKGRQGDESKEERLAHKIMCYWEWRSAEDKAERAPECYNNLNSVFLSLFKIPEKRTELRPDLKNTIISESPDVSLVNFVRVKVFFDGDKEMWQLGDEEPLDPSVLNNIITHNCSMIRSDVNTTGTMLELWHSLLLHCPDCITEESLTQALYKVNFFVKEKELSRLERVRSVEAKEIFYNIHAFFLHHFPQNVIRPDLGTPVVSNCPELASMEKVRAKVLSVNKVRKQEKWKMGDEEPMNANILHITAHSCRGHRLTLEVQGTMLDLWHSMLLRCPDCTNSSYLKPALEKVRKFIELEIQKKATGVKVQLL